MEKGGTEDVGCRGRVREEEKVQNRSNRPGVTERGAEKEGEGGGRGKGCEGRGKGWKEEESKKRKVWSVKLEHSQY